SLYFAAFVLGHLCRHWQTLLFCAGPLDIFLQEFHTDVLELLVNFLQFFFRKSVNESRVSEPRIPPSNTFEERRIHPDKRRVKPQSVLRFKFPNFIQRLCSLFSPRQCQRDLSDRSNCGRNLALFPRKTKTPTRMRALVQTETDYAKANCVRNAACFT